MSDQVLKVLQQPPFQIYELLTAAQGTLQVEAINAGGGGGAGLTSGFFVDKNTTVAPADQTGSDEAPFSTLAAAIAALPDTIGGTLLVAPGTYNGVLDSSGKPLTVIGLCGPQNDATRAAAVVDCQGVNLSSNRAVNLVNVLWGGVDLTIDPESLSPLVAVGVEFTGGTFFESARLTNCKTLDLQASGPVFLDSCEVVGSITCAGEPVWNNSSVSGSVTCEDLTCNDCTIGGSITNASLFDPLVFNHCTVGSIVSLATVTLLNGSQVSATLECVGLTCRDSTVTGEVTCTGDLSCSDSQFASDVTTNRVLLASDTSFQGVACTQAAFSHFKGCSYNTLAGVAGANVDLDSYSLGSGPPTTFDSVTLVHPFADLVVNVPVLAANAIGTVNVSTAATGLAGLVVGDVICANEPAAGVAGGGFLGSAAVRAADSIRFLFHGPTTGGNQTFRTVRV
jgi:hypothetical protein